MAQHTTAPTRPAVHQFARPFAIVAACLLGLLLPCAPVSAQVEPIEAKWMTVTRDTPMRCGELATFYKVADLKAGDVVRVDAVSPRWARLMYPAGQHAFVSKRDSAGVASGKLTLTESARVRAPNAISGLTGSWRSLYLGDIKKGAELEIAGEAKAADGQVVGYRIVPPTPPVAPHLPWGYAELSALRDATASEIASHEASLSPPAPAAEASQGKPAADPAAESAAEPAPAEPESDPNTEERPGSSGTPDSDQSEQQQNAGSEETTTAEPESETNEPDAPEQPAEQPIEEPAPRETTPDSSLLEEMVPPSAAPAEAPAQTQPEPQPSNENAGTPAAQQPAAESTPAAQAPAQPVQTWLNWADLESELVRARRSGGDVLEDSLEELIAEYERTMTNSPNPNVRAAVSSRLEWLRARRDARDQRRALDAAMAEAERLRSNAQSRVRTWRSNRGYDIVGRLVPSGIYDGRRLPRMYRIQAVAADGLVRTIGYIRESETLNIESQLGQIVGVVGEARLDEALRLRVITPRSVERLGPAAEVMPDG